LGISSEVTILAVGGAVDPVSQTVLIRASFNSLPEDVLPGMSGMVRQ